MTKSKRKRKLPPMSKRCTAKTKSGNRCAHLAKVGNRCLQHPPKKRGRPLIEWDVKQWEQFDIFCAAHESLKDIAEAMGFDKTTIDSICKRDRGMNFSTYAEQKRGWGRSVVAGKILELAVKGDVQLLKHLGKWWLGHRDEKKDISIEIPDGPVEVITEVRFVTPDKKVAD